MNSGSFHMLGRDMLSKMPNILLQGTTSHAPPYAIHRDFWTAMSHTQLQFSFFLARHLRLFCYSFCLCLFQEMRVPMKSAEFPLLIGISSPQCEVVHSVCKNQNSDFTSIIGEVLEKLCEKINKVSSSTARMISQSGGWNSIGIPLFVFHHEPHFELRHCIFWA